MDRRQVFAFLPWLLITVVLGGCVTREISWRTKADRISTIENLLREVHTAPDVRVEREAVGHLVHWKSSQGIMLGLAAYSRKTGQPMSLNDVIRSADPDALFEIGFDMDGDHTPERKYWLLLKDPSIITELMRE